MQKYVFLLWREPDLSFSEIKSLFWDAYRISDFAVIEADRDKIDKYKESLWWTIKIGLILEECMKKNDILSYITEHVDTRTQEDKKLRIGLDSFVPSLTALVFKLKEKLKARGRSIRVVQHENWRIKTATTLHEKLIENGIELMIFPDKNGFTIAETIWVQNIENYSERDMNRDRSMTVGMMPPKIAQIMINLASKWSRSVALWDPFCWLGTTLIEASHSGFTELYGSDIEPSMVEKSQKNMEKQPLFQENINLQTFALDAKKIDTFNLVNPTIIVTEGMLGTNFTAHTLTQSHAYQERKKLTELYTDFLDSAYNNKNIDRIAFCLPFWNINKEVLYMPEVSSMNKKWSIDPLSLNGKRYLTHMRPGQCVWREIIVLKK